MSITVNRGINFVIKLHKEYRYIMKIEIGINRCVAVQLDMTKSRFDLLIKANRYLKNT